MSPPDLKLKLSHDFLAELNEKVAGWLKLEMIEREEIVQSIAEPISLLAQNEWCGLVALPEILAAFVLPNDPAVMTILGRASELLKEATGAFITQCLSGQEPEARLGTGGGNLQGDRRAGNPLHRGSRQFRNHRTKGALSIRDSLAAVRKLSRPFAAFRRVLRAGGFAPLRVHSPMSMHTRDVGSRNAVCRSLRAMTCSRCASWRRTS